jgi:hypothetical protein
MYYKGELIVDFLENLNILLDWLVCVDNYIELIKLSVRKKNKTAVNHYQNHILSLLYMLHEKPSVAYQNSIHDKGNKKVVRIVNLTSCQGTMTTEVSKILESQGATVEEISNFFEQELFIYSRDDGTVVINHRYGLGTLPIVYFVDLHNALEWLCKIGHYVFIYERFKSAKQAAAVAVEKFTPENSSQVGLSQQDSIQKNVSLTEAFLEKKIPQLSDNFALRIDFDQFLKQTQRHEYVYHKLNQERLILKDKSFPSIYRTPSFLRIVLSDNSQLDTEKNKTIVTKSCVVEFVYNESTVTKKAVLDFRMFKFNEYKRNDFVAALARYLEITDSVINSIVSHWKYIDNKQESSKEQKIAKVKEAIWKYLDTRCFEYKLMVGQPPKVSEVRDTYLFYPAKFIEYFNQYHGKDFKLVMQTTNLAVSVTIKRSGSNSYRYETPRRDDDTVSYVFDNRDAAIHHLLYYVKL